MALTPDLTGRQNISKHIFKTNLICYVICMLIQRNNLHSNQRQLYRKFKHDNQNISNYYLQGKVAQKNEMCILQES